MFLLLFMVAIADGARILGVFIVPSISHQAVFRPIWRELSLRGHDVTVFTSDPLDDPSLINLTEIDMGYLYDVKKKINTVRKRNKDLPIGTILRNTFGIITRYAVAHINHPKMQELINNPNRRFDLLLVEFVSPLITTLSTAFNCPMIGMVSYTGHVVNFDTVGNPSHPLLYSNMFPPTALTFTNRLVSVYQSVYFRWWYYWEYIPKQDELAKTYFEEDLPYVLDIEKNVSVLFTNSHPVVDGVKPTVPALIELSFMHLQEKKSVPQDLQKELDDATEGVVYFSLGSNVRSANLSTEVRSKIISALSQLPYKVLWKWEEDHLPGKPKNVVVQKWFPQQDVLGHKNVKVFFTQGGQQSIEEAVSNGVPLVGMPFFGDQPLNVMKMIHLGIAKSVDPEKFTARELKDALIEVAEDAKYRNRIREIRDLAADVPMTGLEKAVWWTEYVIRHKGARHLRSPALDLPLYQYFLLDVLGFVLAVVLVALFIVYKIVKLLFRLIRGSPAKVKTS